MTGYGKEKELEYQDLLDQNHIKYAYQIKYDLFSFNNKINKICDFILYIDEKRYCIEIKNQTTSGSVFEKIGFNVYRYDVFFFFQTNLEVLEFSSDHFSLIALVV